MPGTSPYDLQLNTAVPPLNCRPSWSRRPSHCRTFGTFPRGR